MIRLTVAAVLGSWMLASAVFAQTAAIPRLKTPVTVKVGFAVETRGRTAHGSRPMRGLNPVDLMTEQVRPRLKATPMTFERNPVFMIQEPTWNVGTIEGGVGANVVADRCRATTDLRLVPGQDPAAAYGPGNPTGHEPNEYAELTEVVRCTKVLALAALRACGAAR